METIVVGVDGSEGNDHAVRFAAQEARLRDAQLQLVTAWHVPTAAYGGVGVAVMDLGTEFEEDARQCLQEVAKRLAADLAGLDVEHVVREGRASRALVEESEDAALLVVGSRGRGGFVGMLLGSVSSECAQHTSCPVAIVPPIESG